MGINRVGTLKLNGEDAVNFANSFFFPTKDDIINRINIMENIDRHITIRRNETGFEAEIDDLDLSFLEETNVEEK